MTMTKRLLSFGFPALLALGLMFAVVQSTSARHGDEAKAESFGYGGGHTAVTICHKPGKHAKTLVVDGSAVPAHVRHGDTLGPCP